MRFLERTAFALLGLLLWSTAAHAAESYKIDTQVDGQTVTTFIHLFDESPLDNPTLLDQIRAAELDHVAFLQESAGQDRQPNHIDSLEELRGQIQTQTQVPIVELRQNKGFFARLRQMWDASFKAPEFKPGKADYRYGLISTIGASATISVMVFSSPEIPIESGLALVATQTLLSYFDNVWNNSINHFLSSSLRQAGRPASNTTYFFRNLAYDYLFSQVLKLAQSARSLLTAKTQSTILMNTLMGDVGDIVTNNVAYKSFQGDKAKLAKMNFYIGAISSLFSMGDLLQHHLMPVITKIGAYEFRLSGVILISYYIGILVTLKKYPEQFYKVVDGFEKRMGKLGSWFVRRAKACSELFTVRIPAIEGPDLNGAGPHP